MPVLNIGWNNHKGIVIIGTFFRLRQGLLNARYQERGLAAGMFQFDGEVLLIEAAPVMAFQVEEVPGPQEGDGALPMEPFFVTAEFLGAEIGQPVAFVQGPEMVAVNVDSPRPRADTSASAVRLSDGVR